MSRLSPFSLKVKYSACVGLMLCGLAFGQASAPQSVELPSAEQQQADTLVMDSTLVAETGLVVIEPPAEQQLSDTLVIDSALVAETELIDSTPQYHVAQTDSITGEKVYVPVDKYAQPWQTVYIVQESEPGSGQYFYIALSEQPVSVRMPPVVPPEPLEKSETSESLELSEAPESESLELPEPEPVAAALSSHAEKTSWHKTAKNHVLFDPIFLITNVGLGIVLGLDGLKDALNEQLETEVQDLYVVSEMILNAKGKATVTGAKSSGFGFALQYERQLLRNFALMGRFSYAGLGLKMDFEDMFVDMDYSRNINGVCVQAGCEETVEKFSTDLGFYNWSLELHNRYYPKDGGSLFLDGVIGFGGANLSTKKTHVVAEGDYIVKTPDNTYKVESGSKTIEVLNVSAKRGYMTLGPMFGWREVFGKEKGGFVWETSIGYLFGIGFGKSVADQITDGNIAIPHTLGEYSQDIDDSFRGIFKLIENLAVVGGPRLRITFGWAF